MNQACDVNVTTSVAGFTRIQMRDITDKNPLLQLFEQSDVEQVVWFGIRDCAFPLSQEQVWEALPYLLTFLDAGRLVKR